MNTNIYYKEQELKSDLYSGRVPLGSIIYVKYRSGNGSAIRFHGLNNNNYHNRTMVVGCGMGWDNGATEWEDLDNHFIEKIELPKQERCESCNKRVYMWHKHAMWCRPGKPFPEYPAQSQSTKQESQKSEN